MDVLLVIKLTSRTVIGYHRVSTAAYTGIIVD